MEKSRKPMGILVSCGRVVGGRSGCNEKERRGCMRTGDWITEKKALDIRLRAHASTALRVGFAQSETISVRHLAKPSTQYSMKKRYDLRHEVAGAWRNGLRLSCTCEVAYSDRSKVHHT